MSTPKYKHLKYEDRYVIQEFLAFRYSFTAIANRIGKDRRAVSKEVYKHRFLKPGRNKHKLDCPKLSKPPYVCNGCPDKAKCLMDQYIYDASIAHNEYEKTLRQQRSSLHISKESIAAINDTIAPLMIHKHHSVNHVYAAHPELLPMSKSTFYRYIDLGILNVRNIDLQRKVKYRVKKEYDYTRKKMNDKGIKVGRFYRDFQDYMEHNPMASVVEMDTVIGTQGGKGGKCFLTLLFRTFNLMLIRVLPYKKAEYVTQTFEILKTLLGEITFSRLFEVIVTDNGTEFSDPESIEISTKTGERLSFVFYCDPNCSWQKGCIEKNHEYIRYVLPKGTSFAGISQEGANLLASHINSVPRLSLNNQSPYEAALGFIGKHNMNLLGIQRINNDDIDLSIRLLKR
ncbi:MAG: IS30 family transposase [Clostridia bacterium]|nr:IS30 family transposase [Clostridia bacterium]